VRAIDCASFLESFSDFAVESGKAKILAEMIWFQGDRILHPSCGHAAFEVAIAPEFHGRRILSCAGAVASDHFSLERLAG
jgi:hypothetical protein